MCSLSSGCMMQSAWPAPQMPWCLALAQFFGACILSPHGKKLSPGASCLQGPNLGIQGSTATCASLRLRASSVPIHGSPSSIRCSNPSSCHALLIQTFALCRVLPPCLSALHWTNAGNIYIRLLLNRLVAESVLMQDYFHFRLSVLVENESAHFCCCS